MFKRKQKQAKEIVINEEKAKAYEQLKVMADLFAYASAKEKEVQDQKALDVQKWFESENLKMDLSGQMPYCGYCSYCTDKQTCLALQQTRVNERLCAKAFAKHCKEMNFKKDKNFTCQPID